MSALVEQPVQDPQGGGQVTGQNSNPNSGNPLTQINAGPAALAMIMIYKAMELYATIIGLQAQQKELMVNAQINAAKAQASETIKEGEAAWSAALVAGILTMSMATLSVGTAIGLQIGMNWNSNAEMQDVTKDTVPMNEMEKSLSVKPEDTGSIGEGAKIKPVEENVIALKNDFERGEYKNAKILKGKGTKKEIEQREVDTKETIRRLKTEAGYDTWESKFLKRLDAKNDRALEITQRQSKTSNYVNMASTTLNALGQGSSSMVQGHGQKEQALHRAAAGLDGTASQIAGSAAGEAGQAQTKAYDAEIQEVQILKEIDRANSVNG